MYYGAYMSTQERAVAIFFQQLLPEAISGFESYQLDLAGDIVDVAFRPENS